MKIARTCSLISATLIFAPAVLAQEKVAADYRVTEVTSDMVGGLDPVSLVAQARQTVRTYLKGVATPGFDEEGFADEGQITFYRKSPLFSVRIGTARVYFEKSSGRMTTFSVPCGERGAAVLSEGEAREAALAAVTASGVRLTAKSYKTNIEGTLGTVEFEASPESGSTLLYGANSRATVNLRTGQIVKADFGKYRALAPNSGQLVPDEVIREGAAGAFARFGSGVTRFDCSVAGTVLDSPRLSHIRNELTEEQTQIATEDKAMPIATVEVRDLDSWDSKVNAYTRVFVAYVDARSGQTMAIMDASFLLGASLGPDSPKQKKVELQATTPRLGSLTLAESAKGRGSESVGSVAVNMGNYWSVASLSKDARSLTLKSGDSIKCYTLSTSITPKGAFGSH